MLLNLKEGEYLGQNLKSLNNSFLKLSITSYEPNCEIEKHYHDNHYISILIKGNYYEKNTFENNLISSGDILFTGHPGCENVNKILSGLEKDGKFSLLRKLKGYNILWIIVYEMTNTLLTGMPKAIFYFLRLIKGEIKIKKLENALLDKYCNRNLS
jgi:hypothetical protein